MCPKLLKRPGVDFPVQRRTRLGKGRDTVLEDEGEFDPRVAGLLVEGLAQLTQERREFRMLRMEEPRDLAHVPGDLAVERITLLDVDARALGSDDDVALNEDGRVLGEDGSVRGVAIGEEVQRERSVLRRERERCRGAVVLL